MVSAGCQGKKLAGHAGKVPGICAEIAFQQQTHAGKCVIHTAPLANLVGQVILEAGSVLSCIVNESCQIPAGGERHRLQGLRGVLCGVVAVLANGLNCDWASRQISPDVGQIILHWQPPLLYVRKQNGFLPLYSVLKRDSTEFPLFIHKSA